MNDNKNNRRNFLINSSVFIAGATILSNNLIAKSFIKPVKFFQEQEVSPNEDLMREHGVLKRVLLAYQEIIDRIYDKKDFPPDAVVDSANIIRNFIENYHEKLEEDYLFPRFKKANAQVGLVDVLIAQHQRGRIVTDRILNLAKNRFKTNEDRQQLRRYLYSFIRMYSPHEAREDTVLFPAFKKIVSLNEYDSLGEEFEEKEHKLFGKDGFYLMVDKVEEIEKRLGIYDLSQFTPKNI